MKVVLLLSAAVFINFVDRGNFAAASPLLKDEFGLTNSQIGLLLSAFFWSYTPPQPVAGWLAQRDGVRDVLPAGLALWAVTTIITGLALRCCWCSVYCSAQVKASPTHEMR